MKRSELNPLVAKLLFQLAVTNGGRTAAVFRRSDGRITGTVPVERAVIPLLRPETAAVALPFKFVSHTFDEDFGVWLTADGKVFGVSNGRYDEGEFDLMQFMEFNELKKIIGEDNFHT